MVVVATIAAARALRPATYQAITTPGRGENLRGSLFGAPSFGS